MIGSFYGRLLFGGGGAEVSLGSAVNSQILTNFDALSTIDALIDAQSSISASTAKNSGISKNTCGLSAIGSISDAICYIRTDYKGRISGFEQYGENLKSNINMETAISSEIDIAPASMISSYITESGRISAISELFDILSGIEKLNSSESTISQASVGLMSVLR
jgi:hypothetical protein